MKGALLNEALTSLFLFLLHDYLKENYICIYVHKTSYCSKKSVKEVRGNDQLNIFNFNIMGELN